MAKKTRRRPHNSSLNIISLASQASARITMFENHQKYLMNFHAQNEIQILIWNFDDGKIQILMLKIIAARFTRIVVK